MKTTIAALVTALLATACAHGSGTSGATSAPNAHPRPRATATAQPRPSAAMSPVASPAAVPSPAPSGPAAATVRPVVPVQPRAARTAAPSAPAEMPQILGASVSPSVVGSGTTIRAVVRTTPGVVSVVAFGGGSSLAVPRVGPGLFAGSTTLPPLPPFAHGVYPVTFVARDARGRSTQSAVGVTVR